MPQLKLGLTSANNSFYDKLTNTYITPGMSSVIVNYDEDTDLSNIALAVLSHKPTLKLYEGKLPQKVVDGYKGLYTHMAHQALERADAVNASVAEVVTGINPQASGEVQTNTGDLITAKNVNEEQVLALDFEEVDEKPKIKTKKK